MLSEMVLIAASALSYMLKLDAVEEEKMKDVVRMRAETKATPFASRDSGQSLPVN